MSENEQGDVRIEIEPFGPGPEVNEEVSEAVLDHPSVQEYLDGTRHRLLSVRLLDAEVEGKPDEPVPPDRYRATIYDYTNNRVVGSRKSRRRRGLARGLGVRTPADTTREEFDEAVEVLLEDEDLGPAIREERLVPYRPMPPLVEAELPDGPRAAHARGRAHAPGARGAPRDRRREHDPSDGVAVRGGAPALALAAAETCGPATPTRRPPQGVAGQFQVNTTAADGARSGASSWSGRRLPQGRTPPVSSSERDVPRQARALRGPRPVLNVQYDGNACGPFRDWLFEESLSRRTDQRRTGNTPLPDARADHSSRRDGPGELPGHRDIPPGTRRSWSASCRRAGTVT